MAQYQAISQWLTSQMALQYKGLHTNFTCEGKVGLPDGALMLGACSNVNTPEAGAEHSRHICSVKTSAHCIFQKPACMTTEGHSVTAHPNWEEYIVPSLPYLDVIGINWLPHSAKILDMQVWGTFSKSCIRYSSGALENKDLVGNEGDLYLGDCRCLLAGRQQVGIDKSGSIARKADCRGLAGLPQRQWYCQY